MDIFNPPLVLKPMDNGIFYLRKNFQHKQQEELIYLLHQKAQGAWSPTEG